MPKTAVERVRKFDVTSQITSEIQQLRISIGARQSSQSKNTANARITSKQRDSRTLTRLTKSSYDYVP
jgi:hypothetical protein